MKDIVEKYIKLRDAKAQITAACKEKTAQIDAALKLAEGALLQAFDAQGIDSVSTASGTAYRTTKTGATVADWDATLGYIKEHELWNMLEHRVAKKAVEEFKAEKDDLPPGVNWYEEVSINVRRA